MSTIFDITSENTLNTYHIIILTLITIYLINSTIIFKYIRSFIIPISSIILLYRCIYQSDDTNTILSYIINFISSFHNKNIEKLVNDLVDILIVITIYQIFIKFYALTYSEIKYIISNSVFNYIKLIPYVNNLFKNELVKTKKTFENDLKTKARSISQTLTALPAKGKSSEEIINLMKSLIHKENQIWLDGKISGAIYHGIESHQQLLNQAFGFYSISNPLHPDIWPSVMKYESEIIAMTASLVSNGLDTVCGSTTSGGTESIILAIKSHRDYYCKKYNIKHPELICSISAHAAVDKACDLMGIRLIKVAMDPNTYKVNTKLVKQAISSNTIMIYSSAPSYPQGVIDPINELSQLAVRYNIGLHVDCCLGGFILPFAKKLGYSVPDYDFSLPGVTSMSLDTHKYGYALKGTSVVLYRTNELRQSQYFCYSDWSGGLYTTPTIAGSRSGGLIAQCWASLVALGEENYLIYTKDILDTTRYIADGISRIPGLKVIGNAEVMIVCFVGVDGINVYSVADKMAKKGWQLNSHQHPACVHICCTVCHIHKADDLLADLKESVEDVRSDPLANKGGNAAIYGMTSSLPNGPVNELLKIYNDVVLDI